MFNFLVFNVDWESRHAIIPRSRILEFTDDSISKLFISGDEINYDMLTKYPCVFGGEGIYDEVIHIGQITKWSLNRTELQIDIAFDDQVPTLRNKYFHEQAARYDLHEFEFSRNHWAVKDRDLFKLILQDTLKRQNKSNVFKTSFHDVTDNKLVSVMMPFAREFDNVYAGISEAARGNGMLCARADDIWENDAVIQDIIFLIERSKVIVCDCTGKNSNVFYEIGVAHSIGKNVIMISQNEQDIPFDLRHLRYLKYLNNKEGMEKLTKELSRRIETLLSK